MRLEEIQTATNWRVYWDTGVNTLGFRGSGTEKAKIDLDVVELKIRKVYNTRIIQRSIKKVL